MKTLTELKKYLKDECFSLDAISIGNHIACDGIVIRKMDGQYIYAYAERGHLDIIRSFSTETELVEYAVEALNANEWNKAHLAAWVWTEDEIECAEKKLKDRGIYFQRNDIPNYSAGKDAYRIFVFGKDILLLESFKKKYCKN